LKKLIQISSFFILATLLTGCGVNDAGPKDSSVRLFIEGDISSRMDDRLLKNYRTMFNMNIDAVDGQINEKLTINNIAILSELAGGNDWNLYFRFFESIKEKTYTTNYTTLLQYREIIGERILVYTFRSEIGEVDIREFNGEYLSAKVDIPLELTSLTERLNEDSPTIEVENFPPMSITLTGSFIMNIQ
jgi:hypothetical protein